MVPTDVINDLQETLYQLMLRNDRISYISIRNSLLNFKIPIPIHEFPISTIFFRGRLNNEGERFLSADKISFNPAINRIHDFGRTNEPFQSVFYCSEDDNTAYSEISEILRLDKPKVEETFTTGIWESTKPLTLSYLPFPAQVAANNNTAYNLNKYFEKYLLENQTKGTRDLLNLYEFISKLFYDNGKESHLSYLVSTAFYNYIMQDDRFDGLIFPSVQNENSGINISLRKELIMGEYVIPIKAIERTFIKCGEKEYIEDVSRTWITEVINPETRDLEWRKAKPGVD